MLFLYPGAFVELHTDQLEIITPLRRLRIYSAGVWHNFVLAVIAYLLSTSLPVLLTPFYIVNNGVLVTWISPVSLLYKCTVFSNCVSFTMDLLQNNP